ncbi:MAG: ABC transporter ATP-binding protein [Kordiimonadaceae bacterium]|nr:ABC transporter ATP-binding protein [Kordiimonadaceae bacterium]MBO6570256.1 ABC transporter ATP-binding protein [Kordiimonadaceae bacterium]MBO6965646.1 ABC transporter ATP-binding protein [Kordiimonadaceae bacterium]
MPVKPATNAPSIVRANSVSKFYDNKLVLDKVSLEASAGELVGLVGANGGGKTTLLRLLTGALTSDAGQVSVLSAQPPYDDMTRKRIGYVPQQLSLYTGMTVLENLRFYADVYAVEDADRIINQVACRFDLDQYLDERVGDLSGGWARVAQLAASLVYSPQVLLLDEPTAGLDASMRSRFWAFLREYSNDGNAVVISTHDLDEAQQCDKVMFLSDGKPLLFAEPIAVIELVSVSIIFIENKEIKSKINKISQHISQVIFQDYLGGFKVLLAGDESELIERALCKEGVEFRRLEPSLADACALKLAESGK